MARKAILYFLKFRGTEPSFEYSHHFVGFGVDRSERSQEAEFLKAPDCAIDSAEILDLIVRFAAELTDQVTQLLFREDQPRGVTGCGIEACQLFAQADEKQSRCVPQGLATTYARHALASFYFHLADERVALGFVNHHFLSNLSEIVSDRIPLRPKRVPCPSVFPIQRLNQEFGQDERLW
jgi:hypothetical protein